MVTDALIRKQFVHTTVSRGIRQIYATQEDVIRSYLQEHTGNLLSHAVKAPFQSNVSDARAVYYIPVLSYLRFLDIAASQGKDSLSRHAQDRLSRFHRSKLALYNRVVWGVLYRETMPELRYGLSAEVREQYRQQLESVYSNQ